MIVVLYVLAVLVAALIVSGVWPRWREDKARFARVQEFERQYRAWVESREHDVDVHGHYGYGPPRLSDETEELRAWLVARRNEMQRDAEMAGKGIVYVAPPPMIGGAYQPHAYFSDLFDEQSFTDHEAGFRLDELATIVHDTERQLERRKRHLLNPWAWLRGAFARLVGLPRYVLRLAGFGTNVTDSPGAKIGTAVWSFLVGAATIGAFVIGLVTLLGD